MNYSNPKIPEEINYSKANPLKELFTLLSGFIIIIGTIIFLVYFFAQSFAHFIPFKYEQTIAPLSNIVLTQNNSEEHNNKTTYLKELGEKLTQHIEMPEDMQINIVHSNSEEINAFASLNGLIVINQGLLDYIESENELAFIIAHEIAHITERHPIKALSSGVIISLGLSIVTGNLENSSVAQTFSSGITTTALHFSRQQESEADKQALNTLYKTYHHTKGSQDFFIRIKKDDFYSKLLYFGSTHPSPQDRINALGQLIKKIDTSSTKDNECLPLPDFLSDKNHKNLSEQEK